MNSSGNDGSWVCLHMRCCSLLLGLAGCAGPVEAPRMPMVIAGAPAPEDAGVIMTMSVCPPDNPFCEQTPLATSTGPAAPGLVPIQTNCGSVPIDLRPAGVNIMIAVDGAVSTSARWSDIGTAIRSLREKNPTAAFGMHVFWADPVDPLGDQATANKSNNGCLEQHDKLLELGDHTAQEMVSFLGNGPQGGVIFDTYQVSPVIDPLNRYLAQDNKLSDPTRTNYLIVFTGGNDNCFGSAFISTGEKLIAYQKLASELSKRNIRLIPVGLDAPSTKPPATMMANPFAPPQGGGFVGTSTGSLLPTDYEVLGTMLKYGGSGLSEVPRIDTAAKLTELVSRVGQSINNCRFELPSALDSSASVNPFELTFSINGKTVPRDRHQTNGWDFVNGSTSSVEFFGQGCQAVQSGQVLQANKSCEQDICGTAAVSAETKPREVLLLLDSSASRTECTDGSLDCLSLPGSSPTRPLTYWETVQHAIESALTAPINEDVAFGMQFFPSKTAEMFSCDVAAAPEIPPAPAQQITIMKQMLEKLPFGLSPVVGILESVATAPGKLADPGVIGAVVLLSDGGDNCSGATQAQAVMRLGAAAKKLHDAGVDVFAIRYGSADGETAQQAEQLNAIANNGGTASTGSVAYIDAKSGAELTSALAAISDRLATCSFTLSGIKPGVDKSRTSLFLNGEQIGFDAKAMKQDGWNWVDAERTTVELYGDACASFKTSRRTRVVVEFGCEPMIVDGPQ
jgi:hypothetical protein